MKTILFSMLLALMICPVYASESKPVLLSGKIENPNSDSLVLKDREGRKLLMMKLGPGHRFKGSVRLERGYYTLSDGKEHASLYLSPGYRIRLELNADSFDETLRFSGKGAAPNNYLAGKYLMESAWKKLNHYTYYAALAEPDFVRLKDSLFSLYSALLGSKKKHMDPYFVELENLSLEFEKRRRLYNYESMHAFLSGNKGFKVSDSFPDPFQGMKFSDDRYIISRSYIDLAEAYLHHQAGLEMAAAPRDYYLICADVLASDSWGPRLREILASELGHSGLTYTRQPEQVYEKIRAMILDTAMRAELDNLYDRLMKTGSGALSPGFSFPDANGVMHSLESLRGNLVFIDIWATWCGPCVYEIPHLESLQDSLKSQAIVFVSISMNDDKTRWKKMLSEKHMEGLQLFAEDAEHPFFKEYIVEGIPRFIAVGKDGRILSANARRPSDPALLAELRQWLNP